MTRDREQRRRDKQAKKLRQQRPQGGLVKIHIERTPHVAEMLEEHELHEIARSAFKQASSLPGWTPGRSYVREFEKFGQRFKIALDNRRDGIYAVFGRVGEIELEPAPKA